jgi:uncharacterized protein (DUF362 family)
MCVDLNRCLYYSDAKGEHFDAPAPVRRVLTVMDGIVAGEGAGPLAPKDVPLGVVLTATDPVALDLAAVRLMGFDEKKLPKLSEPMRDTGLRITAVRRPEDVCVIEARAAGNDCVERDLQDLETERVFEAHPGWQGHVERTDR